jgi:hypothetical protein
MNHKLGLYSSVLTAIATLLFAIFMLIPDQHTSGMLSYGASMLISFGYLGLASSWLTTISSERKAPAYLGALLACMYAVYINLVYYTQLTTVRFNSAPAEALAFLTFNPGTWIFNFDLFGYGIMALSTFFLGLALLPTNRLEHWLRALLMAHGVFAISSILLPLLNVFNDLDAQSGNDIGVLALEFWCAFFTPIMVLAAIYFARQGKQT